MPDLVWISLGCLYFCVCVGAVFLLFQYSLGPILAAALNVNERNHFFLSDYFVLMAHFGIVFALTQSIHNSQENKNVLAIFGAVYCMLMWFMAVRIYSRARVRKTGPRVCGLLLFPFQFMLALFFGFSWIWPLVSLPRMPLITFSWLLALMLFLATRKLSELIYSHADPLPVTQSVPAEENSP